MTTPKPYYTLLARDDASSPWRIEFGDYDRECVEDEDTDLHDANSDNYHFDTRIVRTSDAQADIDAAVATLNN